MNLTDLEAFVAVVDAGSITGAAAALGVPKSTVSRRVARLEDALGVSVLTRASRRVGVTEIGRRLHRRSAPALRQLAEVEQAVVDANVEPSGLLRITTLPALGATRTFAELFKNFRDVWPAVRLELILTARVVDLIDESVDVAIRPLRGGYTGTADGLVMRALAPLGAGLYAAPDYLKRAGQPVAPADLDRHDLVVLGNIANLGPLRLHGPADAIAEVAIRTPAITTNDGGQLVELLVAGAGVGLVPAILVEPWLRTGALTPVLAEWTTETVKLSLVWPESRYMAPAVRAFIDHMATYFRHACMRRA